jgi:hypothetical protein
MGFGADFFETNAGGVTMRCDVLLGNVDLWESETGELIASYGGIADVRAGLAHWSSAAGARASDIRALLEAAVIAITAESEAV